MRARIITDVMDPRYGLETEWLACGALPDISYSEEDLNVEIKFKKRIPGSWEVCGC